MNRPDGSRLLAIALLVLAPIAVFAAMVAADRRFGAPGRGLGYVVRIKLPPVAGEIGLPQVRGPLDASRPLVVIDAGHGGHDPGAGAGAVREKTLTLALAKALRDELLARGGIRVALTREDDSFLVLEERAGIARRLKADLFISIHADSATAEGASGATIYTLSDRGSNENAARLAEFENRADTVNGVELGGQSGDVNAILVDLSQRDSRARSASFAELVLREGQGLVPFRERSMQSAAFVVLKSADLPSVLVESGYISNPVDAARLTSSQGRKAIATTLARAVRVYFARQSEPGAGAGAEATGGGAAATGAP
ncbi:N-acetylmuramoyl-L-alanine amidase [Novosphingobium flavum]|uniref:N-acetylmuramoyl-L-alanine amidase family protein n=1 Tax=Novosphingobium aerophilum TaxID=2839843 RepID=UPI00163AFC96|nr:N-acetylmuramoyl-L-alanine amidase [Novosphingobium aerophilum]MBC2661377.1 N-acetylmuramoyl-L-alanine amidase [Novosphingobium aerophilum]